MSKSIFQARYDKLNREQRKAVDTIDGPVLVIAGPGSGKTELLSLRIANILRREMISPSQILCLTFTDSGASNMRQRLESVIGNDAYRVSIYTFHSFAAHIMQEHKEHFYNAHELSIANDIAKNDILDNIFKELPHDNPLSSYHPKLGYAYYADVKQRISLIKKAGYDADTYTELVNYDRDNLKLIEGIIDKYWPRNRLNVKDLNFLNLIVADLELIAHSKSNDQDNSQSIYISTYVNEIKAILNRAQDEGKTEIIRKWKEQNLIAENDNYKLKELENLDKIDTVAYIYKKYQEAMYEMAIYDYDDMIINLARALREDEELLDKIAEQYTYIMIDEFQDTSNAQLEIVKLITSHRINEGRPNICAVGDDDQAIYKFQGAEINNIIDFRSHMYRDVQVITLVNNYRSTQKIIELSDKVASLSDERLSNRYEDINKAMRSQYDETREEASSIELRQYSSPDIQYEIIARELVNIQQKSSDGSDNTVAIIARNNNSLLEISKHLNAHNIDYEFIYKSNIFNLPIIIDILNIAKYMASVFNNEAESREDILVRIINAKYWGIAREDIFTLAHQVKASRMSWLEAMNQSENTKIKSIYRNLAKITENIDKISLIETIHSIANLDELKNYYFAKDNNRHEYYTYLEALRALYEAIKETDNGDQLSGIHIFKFLQIYEDYDLPLLIENPSNKNCRVTLLTAHRSKGLEFDTVYIIDCEDRIWSKKNKHNIAAVPKYLKQLLSPPDEDENDSIRLLFVAITRTKTKLILNYNESLSRYINKDNIISHVDTNDIPNDNSIKIQSLENNLNDSNYNLIEQNIIDQLLDNYQMSPTHLNNYLDIEKGGPHYFFETNILRFPQPLDQSGIYGSAIHSSIEYAINNKDKLNKLKESLLAHYDTELKKYKLDKLTYKRLNDKGHYTLGRFLMREIEAKEQGLIRDGAKTEINLAREHININNNEGQIANITGKLDYIHINERENTIQILDFKTGKTLESWDKSLAEYEKIKAYKYKNQLMMYRLLIENSTEYSKYNIANIGLQFVEDDNMFILNYEHDEDEYNEFKKLIVAIYNRIMNHQFENITIDNPKLEDYINYAKGLTNTT